jgi:predicted nucleic acid-binding protein
MEYVLADTGLWYAMFDHRDQHHSEAVDKADTLTMFQIVLPWPTLYETLRTKFVRNAVALGQFERFLMGPNITYLDDTPFRQAAFDLSLDSSLRRGRPLSMVDCLIRILIEDVNIRINYLATFNRQDFVDVCRSNRVEII